MPDADLAWRVEEACLNAWPSPRQLMVEGHLLRAAGGPSKRLNSANPTRGAGPPGPAAEACIAHYAALGRRAIFRIPAIAPGLEPVLARAGYAVADETCTLHRALDGRPAEPGPGVALSRAPGAAWLAHRAAATGADAAAARAFRDTVAGLLLPAAFAATSTEDPGGAGGGIGAVAFGALDRGLLVIEAVATPPRLRGRGHARRAVAALMAWARANGAAGACLQVVAANAPARALYAGLGFGRELYRYHYRVGPEPG